MPRYSSATFSLALLAACTLWQDARSAVNQTAAPDTLQLAETMKKSGDPKTAVKILREALNKDPNNTDIMNKLGHALIAANEPVDAVAVFDQWIALKPDSAVAYEGKAMAFDHTGNHLAAEDLYQHALQLSPDSLPIQNNLAMSMILNGQFDPAIVLLEKLNIQNNNKTVRQNLALAYGLKGDKEKALELNLKDLPQDQAKENVRFYEQYAKLIPAHPSTKAASIGFSDTSPAQKTQLETKQAAAAKTAAQAPAKDTSVDSTLSPAAGDSTIFGHDAVYSFPSQGRH